MSYVPGGLPDSVANGRILDQLTATCRIVDCMCAVISPT